MEKIIIILLSIFIFILSSIIFLLLRVIKRLRDLINLIITAQQEGVNLQMRMEALATRIRHEVQEDLEKKILDDKE